LNQVTKLKGTSDQPTLVRLVTKQPAPLVLLPVLFAALVIGGAAYRLAAHYESQRALLRFDEYLAERAFSLEKALSAQAEVLESLRSFFENSVEVTREEFASFTQSARFRHPAVRALEWVPLVPEQERASHERQARSAGLDGYVIRERNSDRELVPAVSRPEYFPVRFVEPLAGNEPAIGFDLGSDAARRAALTRAMRTGSLSLTEPLVLVQDEEDAMGFLALAPVNGNPASSMVSRPGGDLRGFVLLVFRIQDILSQTFLSADQGDTPRFHYCLVSMDASGRLNPIAFSSDCAAGCPPDRDRAVRTIEFGGQEWRLLGHPTEAFLSLHRTTHPIGAGMGAFLVCLLLGSISYLHIKSTQGAEARKSDELYRAVCHSLAEGICVANSEGRLVFCNDSAERILGVRPSEQPTGDWSKALDCYLPDARTPCPAHELPLARALRGETFSREELFIQSRERPHGLWISVSVTPLKSGTDDVQGGICIFEDISAHKAAQESLRQLSNAVEQTADAVFITDFDGVIEYANPAFEALTGYAREEAVGETPRILKSGVHDDEWYRSMWEVIKQGKVFRSLTVNKRKDGEHFFSEQTITPMKDADGHVGHFVSVCKDMTEVRKRQEQELELQLAAQVQERLYPDSPPSLSGIDLAGAISSATLTCGDYLDYLTVSPDALLIAIGDVSGHGLGPAMIMAQTRAYVHSLTASGLGLSEILARTNAFLIADLEDDRFVTLMLVLIDVPGRRLSYASAGHTSGYIISSSGSVKLELEHTGAAMGFLQDCSYDLVEDIEFEAGDILALFTDGLVGNRAPDGTLFKPERAIEIIKTHHQATSQEIVDHLQAAVRDFRSGKSQEDDITMAICKFE